VLLMGTKSSRLLKCAIAFAATAAALAACASTNPLADEKIAVAKDSVQRAERSGAPEFAPVELASARDKLARAEKANADRDIQPATMLAEQANVDAQLAEATAQQQRSHKAATEFDAGMQTLRDESMRSSPPAQ
jgi:lipoprotein-anchoring transpeptidase ErfK/SrfK